MRASTKIMFAVVGVLALAGGAQAQAAEPAASGQQVRQQSEQQLGNTGQGQELRTQQRQRIYGEELMTQQERNQYQERLQNAETKQERKAIEKQNRKAMQARAKSEGKQLGSDGSVMTADQIRERDRTNDMYRDRIHQMDQASRPQSGSGFNAGRSGSGGGSGGGGGGRGGR